MNLISQILSYVFTHEPDLLRAQLRVGRDAAVSQQAVFDAVKQMAVRLIKCPAQELVQKLSEFKNVPEPLKEQLKRLALRENVQQLPTQTLQYPALPKIPTL